MAPPLLLLLLIPLVAATAPCAHPAYPSQPASCAAEPVLAPERRETHGGGRILDITHYYREDMPSWESDGGVGQFLWLPASMRNGSLANNSEMRMPTHTGTHVDAPGHVFQHYFDAGFDVDTLDLDVLNGEITLPPPPPPPFFFLFASNFRSTTVPVKRWPFPTCRSVGCLRFQAGILVTGNWRTVANCYVNSFLGIGICMAN